MSAPVCKGNGTGLERVHYFPRQLITADDMRAEQEYFRQKIRRHNRFLHGWGVVCGLKVEAAATKETPWRVKINPGYALGPYGDEIYVQEPFCLDLSKCGLKEERDPCDPGRTPTRTLSDIAELRFIAIKYVECETRPVRVHPAGCACDETTCEYSRIRDDFKIECLAELPPSHASGSTPPFLCEMINKKELPPCPPCPEDPWVVLAHVVILPSSPEMTITDGVINNTEFRRQLYSTSLLQRQLIACCCKSIPMPVCEAVSIKASPKPLSLNWETSKIVTVTVEGSEGCPVADEMVTANIIKGGRFLSSVTPTSKKTDNSGKAEFTITAAKKRGGQSGPGVARIGFSAARRGGIIKVNVRVKVVP